VFDAAELIRDYLEIEFDGSYTSQVVWVNAVITTTVSSGLASATVSPDNTNGFVTLCLIEVLYKSLRWFLFF
jgi:hypothetical protein